MTAPDRFARGLRGDIGTWLSGAAGLSIVVAVAANDGGERPTTWYPAAVALVLLAVTALTINGRVPGLTRRGWTAIALLAGFTAWSYSTIFWSEVKSDAWDGANRGLLYLAIFSLFAALPWRLEAAAWILGSFGIAVAGLGVGSLWQAAAAADPSDFFQLGRFAQPMNYQNANGALFMIAFWPLVFLASRRRAPVLARGVAATAAATLPQLALLGQSRAWLVAAPVSALVYVAVVPQRGRSLAFLVPPVVATAGTWNAGLNVFTTFQGGKNAAAAVDASLRGIVIWSLLAGTATILMAWVDRSVVVGPERGRTINVLLAALAASAAVGALGVIGSRVDHPVDRVSDAWEEFKAPPRATTDSYFSLGFGGNRYDLWRVAVAQVTSAPLVGVGVDNFAVDYLRDRRTAEEPSYPHSVELRVLAQTGIVGTILLLSFGVAAAAALRPLRSRSRSARGLAAAALVSVFYWLLHGSVDWFWEIPPLGATAFAFLGLAISLSGRRGRRTLARPATAGVLAAGAFGLASLVLPWLAAQEMSVATRVWRADANAAYARLERARKLNRLSSRPDLLAGAIAARLGDYSMMETAFTRASRRNPSDWYAHLELAVVATHLSQPGRARRELAIARRLNPREPALQIVEAAIEAGRPADQASLDRMFLERTRVG